MPEAEPIKCKRVAKPWEDLQGRKDWEGFKWEERTWFADTRHGMLCMAEIARDRDTGQITDTRETRSRIDRGVDFFSLEEFNDVFQICKETDCTIMEAIISLRGEDMLPKAWVQAALNAPEVRYKYAKAYQDIVAPKVEKKVFVDPRAKAAAPVASEPAKEHWRTRKARLAAEAAESAETVNA